MLSCRDLTYAYEGDPLFEGLTFSIQAGERIGLIGSNGSGKSTLLRLLAGELSPDRGDVALARGTKLAYLPQEERFPPEASVESVVAEVAEGGDEQTRLVNARIVLGKVGFTDLAQPAGQLSGGWRKRLAIAKVLVQDPDVVLMDEPTNH
ncbi:MAG TPA: ABC transporter ATP-binding protein, partial [Planctomycetes bacterium]|nr:ABC transporter ATP-binding protein [Planctomycetota bacterium]